MLRFGFGTAIPCLVLSSALVIAGFVLAGADVGTGITLAFTLAFVLAMALEMARVTCWPPDAPFPCFALSSGSS